MPLVDVTYAPTVPEPCLRELGSVITSVSTAWARAVAGVAVTVAATG
ncbi:hypothetical protein [Kitasatospora sp. NPDC017646]